MESTRRSLIQAVFGALGIVVGVVAAWYAHSWTSSWLMTILVLFVTANLIGRGVADVITDPNKGRRIVFFALPAIVTAAVVAGTYWLWEIWWLAAVLGIVGYLVGAGIAVAAFPRIAEEERVDTLQRSAEGRARLAQLRSPEPVTPETNTPAPQRTEPEPSRGSVSKPAAFDTKIFDFNKK